jgi:hypothetical protein
VFAAFHATLGDFPVSFTGHGENHIDFSVTIRFFFIGHDVHPLPLR